MSASGFEPPHTSPEARARITSALLAHGWERGAIKEVFDLYDSELARQIREERKAVEAENVASHAYLFDGMDYAADIIDPHSPS
ncbi:hypothetical protein ACFFS2_22215 [Streptomyces aurantiacus]|uniref:Uncharacterized protein n=1 Tax=Streptomyces aurantiacus TaxID=47760 RepID=A0A7G1P5K7_9ACTN|nr:hypothetical protein [Streptomyces aurantiacus]BCL30569.1 hypothetical protein GCM10017557_54280 [Streptomyces aurantiacus]